MFNNFQNFENCEYKNHQHPWYFGWLHVLEGQDLEFLVKKQSWNVKKNRIEKSGTNFGSQNYMSSYKFQKFEKWEYKNHQIWWYLVPSHVLEGQKADFLVKKGLGARKWGFI